MNVTIKMCNYKVVINLSGTDDKKMNKSTQGMPKCNSG